MTPNIHKTIFTLLCSSLLFFYSCIDQNTKPTEVARVQLTNEMAETLSALPLKCLQKEFPNKLNQSLESKEEMGSPKDLHLAFFGCYDWHSSVHGHWMLVSLLKRFPNLSKKESILSILSENITAQNISSEIKYFNRKSEKSFERTYGWAWLLKLQEELDTWDDPNAKILASNLKPLTILMVSRYMDFLPRLSYPIRSGEHPNTAFGLSLAYDYAISSKNDSLKLMVESRSRDYFANDKNCPMTWEPGGFDFLSPCLEEADLMARILTAKDFKVWLDQFIPDIKNPDFKLVQAKVSDRTDGKLVHLDGVNFCRAWTLYRIAKVIPEYSHLIKIANDHIQASLPNITDGGYEGEHWLASFAIYALTSND
ncbi:MAG: DUF2891 domain-containing protein [Saprospiraceae bacterium]|nr:DUF2891 domain-containing protein [Saprospiraceae bacterium]